LEEEIPGVVARRFILAIVKKKQAILAAAALAVQPKGPAVAFLTACAFPSGRKSGQAYSLLTPA
jgi:hypothetical protein